MLWHSDPIRAVAGLRCAVLAALLALSALASAAYTDVIVNGFKMRNHDMVALAASGYWFGMRTDGAVASNSPYVPPGLTGVVQIAATTTHRLFLHADGTVLQDNTYYDHPPASIQGNVRAVAAAPRYSVAIVNNGRLRDWGQWYGPDAVRAPKILSQIVQVAVGADHALALQSDGTVQAWGRDDYGQNAVPSDLTDVVQVACGYHASYAVRSDGTVVGWGDGANASPTLSHVVKIAASNSAAVAGGIALLANGRIKVWGNYGTDLTPSRAVRNAVDIAVDDHSWYALRDVPIALELNKVYAIGDSTDTLLATVTLNRPADAATTIVLDGSGAPNLELPATVTVHKGQTRAKFSVLSTSPNGDEPFGYESNAIRASVGADFDVAYAYIAPLTVYSWHFEGNESSGYPYRGAFYPGKSYSAEFMLNGVPRAKFVVQTAKADPAHVCNVPGRIEFAAGANTASIPLTVEPVQENTKFKFGFLSRLGNHVLEPCLAIAKNPLVVVAIGGGYGASERGGFVSSEFNAPAGGTPVTFALDNNAFLPLAPVTIPEGTRFVRFTALANDVPQTTTHITATGPAGSITGPVVTYANTVHHVTLNPAIIASGGSTTGTVTLRAPVWEDVVVNLSLAHPALGTLPATVTVPAGAISATFTVTAASGMPRDRKTRVAASRQGDRRGADLTITKAP